METLIAVIVAVTFAGLAWPQVIRHRRLFFLSMVPTLFLLLLYVLMTVAALARSGDIAAFFAFLAGLLQIAAVVLLILAISGLSPWELLQEIAASFRSMKSSPQGFPVVPPPPPGRPGDGR